MWISSILSVLPFTVNVSGRKHDIIVKLCRYIDGDPKGITLNDNYIITKSHPKSHIIAFAGKNFLRNFKQSDLGKYMISTLNKDDLFVDIGANLGGFSLLAKECGARTICVEAAPELAAFLSENEQSFGKTYSVAVSDQAGSAPFFLSDSNMGGNSLIMSSLGWEESGYSSKTEVVTKRLDELFQLDQKIHLLKIDVEGHEEAVVKGASGLIEAGMVESIWCEVRSANSDRNPNSYKSVCKYLDSMGYDVFRFSGSVTAFDWQNPENLPQFFDLLFLPK
jgi:FkbM family methyltransferase|tara:strand:+ start:263 stop:1099 length:837 start_codon:yes stop_codon:yes gene_type:complete